jgi:hypothetical protein
MSDTRKSDKNLDQDKKKSPKNWKGPPDARREEGAGKYPNQFLSAHSRSGHSIVIDDSEGKESMTFQHRGGSAMQFLPNGAIQVVAHNSMYHLVFGQNRLSITGANDLTVKGDGSMLVYGDFNKTVHGDINWTATGDFNVTAENMNSHIRGNIDTQAKNETKKLEGSMAVKAQGAIAMASKDSLTAVSLGDQVHIGGGSGLNLFANEGNITGNVEKGNFHFEAKDGTFEAKIKDAIKLLSDSGAMHLIAQEAANIIAKSGNIHINSQSGDIHVKADSGMHHLDASLSYMQSGTSQAGSPEEATGATGEATAAKTTSGVQSDSKALGKLN